MFQDRVDARLDLPRLDCRGFNLTMQLLINIDVPEMAAVERFYHDIVVEDLDSALIRAAGHEWCLLQFVGRGYDEIATS